MIVFNSFKIKFPSYTISADIFFLPSQWRKPFRYCETPTNGDKRSLGTHHSMKRWPRSSGSPLRSSHETVGRVGRGRNAAPLRQSTPDLSVCHLSKSVHLLSFIVGFAYSVSKIN